MAEHHYVARTYLRNWCLDRNKPRLQAYRKSDLKQFSPRPKDVCSEWDGDLNPNYFDNPSVLGDFRKIFEPKWKPTVERVGAGIINQEDKLVISLAWAHFFLCTPSQRAITKDIYANEARALALNVEIEHKHDFFKRLATKYLQKATWFLYNQDWIILLNETEMPFITSDNPSAFVPESNPPERILPITPSLCLYAKTDMSLAEADHVDLGSPPKGSITFTKISRHDAMKINRYTVISANDLVFSRSVDDVIAALVKEYCDVRPQVEPMRGSLPAENGTLKGATLTIRPRTI
jgi:hypothetical protein